MDGDVIATKTANALFASAQATFASANPLAFAASVQGAVNQTLSDFQQRYGGLWVGGTATLTRTSLQFEPNALNRAVHVNGDSLRAWLDLRQVLGVQLQPGFVTKIVAVTVPDGVFKLRCFGAREFAGQIGDAVAAARGGGSSGPSS